MLRHSEFRLTGTDRFELFAQAWSPEHPRAVVCLVHGLGEHGGRYEPVARNFNDAGFAVITFDQRGHGKTHGPRGTTPPFDILISDVGALLNEAGVRFPGLPRFLYGHSLGGNEVLVYAIRHRTEMAGVVATSPGLRTAFRPPVTKLAAGKILYRLAPRTVLSSGLELAALCRDPGVVSDYIADPLVHDRLSAQLGLDMLRYGEWALEHAAEFPLVPLLLVHGGCDRLTSAPATAEFASRVKGDVTFKLWPDCYHETHNEPEGAEVLAFTVNWLNQRLLAGQHRS